MCAHCGVRAWLIHVPVMQSAPKQPPCIHTASLSFMVQPLQFIFNTAISPGGRVAEAGECGQDSICETA